MIKEFWYSKKMIPKYAKEAIDQGKKVERYFCLSCNQQKYFNVSSSPPLCLKCGNSETLEVKRTLTPKQKDEIRHAAGDKCANPGCSVWRTHVHHIDEWAIYHSDDPEILIPVCPTCHDQIHHGSLPISREILVEWKAIRRNRSLRNLHIYVEPGENIKFRAGGLWLASSVDKMKLELFKFAPSVKVDFITKGNKVSLVDISITDLNGEQVIEVLSNYIQVKDEELEYEERTGHIRISTADINRYLPQNLVEKMRSHYGEYAKDRLTLLELQVLKQGQLALNGCWYHDNQATIMTNDALTFVPQMTKLVSNDSDCTLTYTGDKTLFATQKSVKPVKNTGKLKKKTVSKRKAQKEARRKNRKN